VVRFLTWQHTEIVSNLDRWNRDKFTFEGVSHSTYRRGSGPGVIVMHEIPGLTPRVIEFADEVVEAGFTVVMPQLFGKAGAPPGLLYEARSLVRICISREFTTWQLNRTSPVVTWLRALARQLQVETGGRVGAVGMCLTGGFALAMMTDEAVEVPVMAQPSLPFAIGKKRRGDINLSAADLSSVQDRCARGAQVLGLQYKGDWRTGTRFDTFQARLAKSFIRVDLDGPGHSTLTEDRNDTAVAHVIDFLRAGNDHTQ
jgi:dienelactone hydrolase